ncbi:hypothetical protein [Pandoraea faecigallinarum]|uniref:hypothetical protein n=1 Tax=Pandoraea faecigallinarum TaxID=656179 RepID=UPI00064B9528|nr:hypothetical protein [Pandoraea faecigallinarum]
MTTITDKAFSGQQFFGLPEFVGTPTATVNGEDAPLTSLASGVFLTTPCAQDDEVIVTFERA